MGVLRPLVKLAQRDRPREHEPSDRIITPATVISASRPVLGAMAANKLRQGERGALPLVVVMAATDMEGWLAALIDKFWPESGLGASKFGAKADQYADTAAVLEVSLATLAAPRVSWLGKAAVGTMLLQEGYKTTWALRAAKTFYNATGDLLDLPTALEGKEAMAEKLVAVCAAVATGETDNQVYRTGLGSLAMGFAASGSWRGERVRQVYDEEISQLLQAVTAESRAT